MKIHELKCWNKYFSYIWDGKKTFDIRLNDRNFQEGDFVLLREYNSETQTYGAAYILAEITYILKEFLGLQSNYVILALDVVAKRHTE